MQFNYIRMSTGKFQQTFTNATNQVYNVQVCSRRKSFNKLCTSYSFQANVTGTSTMGTISGLSSFTNYNCTVYAVIMSFVGLMSEPIVVRTAEAGL